MDYNNVTTFRYDSKEVYDMFSDVIIHLFSHRADVIERFGGSARGFGIDKL